MIKIDAKMIVIGGLLVLLAGGAYFLRAHHHTAATEKSGAAAVDHYTCPMHPHIHEDKPGECPICHMKLVPVYKDVGAPLGAPENGMAPGAGMGAASSAPTGVLISPERQQLIGVRTTAVVREPAVKELRTSGRVAFDPELAAAEREFVEISHNVPTLKMAAISRLKVMGLGDDEILALEKKGKVTEDLFLPTDGGLVWIYATLYGAEIDLVKPGMEARINSGSDGTENLLGTVRAVDRVLDPMTRSARARIEVPGAGGKIRPQTFVTVALQIPLGDVMTLPKSAVITTGTRKIAFVIHDGRRFEAREIKTGAELTDDVVVTEGIEEGDEVVASAAFMVDAESQLKAAIAGMGAHSH